jgi:coenzyme PQQ synthesis protein D (PqqD)
VSGTAIDLQSIVVVSKNQLASAIGAETVILGLQAGRYYGVDAVGSRVWQIIQEPARVGDIRNAIVAEYDVEPAACESDLLKLLADMQAAQLIEVRTESAS